MLDENQFPCSVLLLNMALWSKDKASDMRLSWRREENRFRFFLLIIVVLSIDVLVVIYFRREEAKPQITKYDHAMTAEEFVILFNDTYGLIRTLKPLKLENGGHIRIADVANLHENGTKLEVIRFSLTGKFHRGSHTQFRLKIPREITMSNVDTAKWDIDKSYIFPGSYYHYIAEAVFYCDAVELSRDSRAKILMLGLGGGLINSYLHYNFPKMSITVVEISATMLYIASKWFGLELDENHRVVVTDGVDFIQEQIKKGVKYDALILDACYTERDHSRMCPVDTFLEERVIRMMSQVIDSKGILILNSVPVSKKMEEESNFLAEKFLGFFRFCDTRITVHGGNAVFYCMHQSGSKKKHVDLLEFVNNTALIPADQLEF